MAAKNEAAPPLGTQSISRVFALLREIADCREGMRLVDVARRLEIRPPTAHRILKCLLEERALRRDVSSKRYFLGPALYELGLVATPRIDMRTLCAPVLERLAEATEDMIFLTVRSGSDGVCLSRREGKFPVKTYTLDVGMRRPLGVGAGSLAILAALSDAQIADIIGRNAARLQQYDGLSEAALMSQVRRVQKLGYAVRDLRGLGGVRTVGVAVRGNDGVPIAALSLSAIRPRMKDDRVVALAKLLRREAAQLEEQLVDVWAAD